MVGELVTYSKDLRNKFEYAIINNANRIKVENTNILKKGTYMKKFNTIAIISLLSLSMVACGSKDKPTKVTPDFTQKESAKENVKETIKETNKETEKETSKESEQTADKGTETKPSNLAPSKPSEPSKPALSNPATSKPSTPIKPTPSNPTPAKKKVWIVDVPYKAAVYKTEKVLVKPAKDAVYEDKTVVITPEQQKEEIKGKFVLDSANGEQFEFYFNTKAEASQAAEEMEQKEIELARKWVSARSYEDYHTYYVTIPAETKTERVLVSEAQEAVYEDKRVLVSPEVKEKGHWEWR